MHSNSAGFKIKIFRTCGKGRPRRVKQKKMKIEVGKEYIDGHGTIVKILSFVYGAMRYRFKGDNGEIYDVEGNSNPDDPMAHLVSETPTPATPS